MKINDWVSITADFDNLQKLLLKARNITSKEGIPRFYVRACLSIEDLCLAATTDKEKKSTSNAKALNIMRQKLRKWTKEYAPQIAAYKANPLVGEEEEPETKAKKPKPVAARKPKTEEKKKVVKKKSIRC